MSTQSAFVHASDNSSARSVNLWLWCTDAFHYILQLDDDGSLPVCGTLPLGELADLICVAVVHEFALPLSARSLLKLGELLYSSESDGPEEPAWLTPPTKLHVARVSKWYRIERKKTTCITMDPAEARKSLAAGDRVTLHKSRATARKNVDGSPVSSELRTMPPGYFDKFFGVAQSFGLTLDELMHRTPPRVLTVGRVVDLDETDDTRVIVIDCKVAEGGQWSVHDDSLHPDFPAADFGVDGGNDAALLSAADRYSTLVAVGRVVVTLNDVDVTHLVAPSVECMLDAEVSEPSELDELDSDATVATHTAETVLSGGMGSFVHGLNVMLSWHDARALSPAQSKALSEVRNMAKRWKPPIPSIASRRRVRDAVNRLTSPSMMVTFLAVSNRTHGLPDSVRTNVLGRAIGRACRAFGNALADADHLAIAERSSEVAAF
jgi:hypothetical protein